jgi:hypothetical protein
MRAQRIAAGAHGWRLKVLPWLRNNPVVQQLEVHDRVVAAMQPSDRVDPANLGAEAKSKIAVRSGCTLQQVNSVIKQVLAPPHPLLPPPLPFTSRSWFWLPCATSACFFSPHLTRGVCLQVMASRNMHGWMQRLKDAGRPIPQSHEDMERIATQPDNLMTKAFTRRR